MWDTSGAKYKHMLYNVSWARKKSWNKLKNAIKRFISLIQKEKKRWSTKWIQKTRIKADARLKKYWVTQAMLDKELKNKNLDS